MQQQTLSLSSQALRVLAGLLVLTALVAMPAAADEALAFPHLQWTAGSTLYQSHVDLQQVRVPMVEVTNPSKGSSVTVELIARSVERGEVQSHLVQLPAGGSMALAVRGGHSSLSLLAKGPFEARLVGAERGSDRVLEVSGALVSSATGAEKFFGLCEPACIRDWKLTCSSGGCSGLGPFTEPGRVLCHFTATSPDRVYWNLNTPTGPWTTIGDQAITATWGAVNGDGCPTTVTNSLGHTYSISFP